MGLKLKDTITNNWIHPVDMKRGQIGIIRAWTGNCYTGELIMKGITEWFKLNDGDKWVGLTRDQVCKVEILGPGTALVIN